MSVTIEGAALKKWTHEGATVKQWVHEGVTVWKSAVTLVNSVGSAVKSHTQNYEAAGSNANNGSYTLLSLSGLVPGHRYFIRAAVTIWGGGGSKHAVEIVDGSKTTSLVTTATTANKIYAVQSTAMTIQHSWSGESGSGNSVGTAGYLYMVVDVSELEEMYGSEMTAGEVWAAIGSAVFYGSKEVEI